MSGVSLKRQIFNYSRLFKQVFVDYYRQQYRLFWLIQVLMMLATVTGLMWIMGIILGISHHQNPTGVQGIKYAVFFWVFEWPLWQWLLLASVLGAVSAWASFLSIQYGVKSVLSYQRSLSQRCLKLVSNKQYHHWTEQFQQAPKQSLLRVLRQGVQLNGLVVRRITRAFVSVITFVLAMSVLLYVDAMLLSLLVPLAVLYVVALYFINRYTARVSNDMGDMLPVTSQKFNRLVSGVLNDEIDVNTDAFQQQYHESLYMQHTRLKYLRRLSEVHVNWLNTLFLVLAMAFIIIYLAYIQSSSAINWQQLLFFLIALKYAAGSLQEVSTTTVAFSRFLPEIRLLYRLLDVVNINGGGDKVKLCDHVIIYLPVQCIDHFTLEQLHHRFQFSKEHELCHLIDLRQKGMLNALKELSQLNKQVIIVDHRLQRLQRIINDHRKNLMPWINDVLVFSHNTQDSQRLTIDEFLNHAQLEQHKDCDDDIDAFE